MSQLSRLGRKVFPREGYAHGSYPIMRENGVLWVMEWVVELWANSAMGSSVDHSSGLFEVNSLK